MTSEPPGEQILAHRWLGADAPYLDAPFVTRCGSVVAGCYGGSTAVGADKNEDGALVWCAADGSWEFALLLDAHFSSQSATLILGAIEAEGRILRRLLDQPAESAFPSLHQHLYALFRSPAFRAECRQVIGEASCLICARKENFLWWLNVGDCVAYLFHPELARLGQYALNQRSFFEWIGHTNTFDLPVPCYATGTRELFRGQSRIVMVTDGLLEFGRRPFENPVHLYRLFMASHRGGADDLETNVRAALAQVHQGNGRDSATIVAWNYTWGAER
ncbi:MAG TPA: protein phosphatase 2C domain-containing protein [Ardenticatenaceae bacterium]|nr:protein phosphatase 2C domain-containing protein [Ardenticatenaceae bacterium]